MTKLSTAHTDAFNDSVTKETATGGAGDYDVAAGGANGGGSDNPQGASGIGAMTSGEIYLAAGAMIEIGGGRGKYTPGGTAANAPAALDALTRNAPSTLTGGSNGVEGRPLGLSNSSGAYAAAPTTAPVTADILAGGSAKTLGVTGQIVIFGYTGKIESFPVHTAGYYDITAVGAQGGGFVGGIGGGLGAFSSGDIYLQANAILDIVVVGVGGTSSFASSGGGGGGGSFVIEANNGSGAVDVNEVIAGGGGGVGGPVLVYRSDIPPALLISLTRAKFQQLGRLSSEGVRELPDYFQTCVKCALFQLTKIAPADLGLIREVVLRHALGIPQPSQISSENLPQVHAGSRPSCSICAPRYIEQSYECCGFPHRIRRNVSYFALRLNRRRKPEIFVALVLSEPNDTIYAETWEYIFCNCNILRNFLLFSK